MATRKPAKPSTPAKKTPPKKEKRDFAQVALSIVEKVTGGPLAGKPRRK